MSTVSGLVARTGLLVGGWLVVILALLGTACAGGEQKHIVVDDYRELPPYETVSLQGSSTPTSQPASPANPPGRASD